ncbi:MAG: FAD:protein FMN transferase [Balneolaceae bacterium]|nr:FAD:protein FMN transferase [Balneolaceae bacterium]
MNNRKNVLQIKKVRPAVWGPVAGPGHDCRSVCYGRGLAGLLIIVGLVTISCSNRSASQHLEGTTMGTFYTVSYRADISPHELKSVLNKHLSEIEVQLSNWDNDSWISRFNHSQNTDFVPIPMHAYRVVKNTLDMAVQTNRALDPTLGSLINLWGFGPVKTDHPPDTQTIREALEATGPEKIVLKDEPERIAKLDPGLQLNVSSVAKGYAADLLARALNQQGVTDYLVNIGGEMRVSGHPDGGPSWKVAIQKPEPGSRDGQAHVTIQLSKGGLATSGDYRRFLDIDGQRYPHILDPETGRPVQTDLASATIIAPTSMQADGLATACLVLGLQKAQELIAGIPGTKGLFIQRIEKNQFRTVITAGWSTEKS